MIIKENLNTLKVFEGEEYVALSEVEDILQAVVSLQEAASILKCTLEETVEQLKGMSTTNA